MTYIWSRSAPNADTVALSLVILLERDFTETSNVIDFKELQLYVHRRWREDFGHIASQDGSGEDDRITINQFVEHSCCSGMSSHFSNCFGAFTRILPLHQEDINQGWRIL